MKLIMAIISKEDTSAVASALSKAKFYMTRLSTTGGFLRAGNTTILIGTDDDKVDECIEIIGANAKQRAEKVNPDASYMGSESDNGVPLKINAGGATVFVMNIRQFEKL